MKFGVLKDRRVPRYSDPRRNTSTRSDNYYAEFDEECRRAE